MAEEIENASIVVPKAIVLTYASNGVVAFLMLIVFLFALQDTQTALASSTNYP